MKFNISYARLLAATNGHPVMVAPYNVEDPLDNRARIIDLGDYTGYRTLNIPYSEECIVLHKKTASGRDSYRLRPRYGDYGPGKWIADIKNGTDIIKE